MRRYNRSAVSLGAVQDFLGRYCVKTGHHYAVIAAMSGREQTVGGLPGLSGMAEKGYTEDSEEAGDQEQSYTY